MSKHSRVHRRTNVEFITEMMEFSHFGALAQLFVIDAITKHAQAVAASENPELFSTGLFDGQAWIDCAKDIHRQIEEFYGNGL